MAMVSTVSCVWTRTVAHVGKVSVKGTFRRHVTHAPRSTSRRTLVRASADPFDNEMGNSIIKKYGTGEGKRVHWGVLSQEVPESELNNTSKEVLAKRAALREAAAAELVNIGQDERSRRKTMAAGAGLVALVVATGLTANDVTNPLIRGAAMYLPLAIAFGFYGSGQQGL